MTATAAALAAIYPVVICLGVMLFMRYAPVVHALPDPGTRFLVIGMLFIVATIVLEQIWYGYGRLDPAVYETMAQWLPIVGLLKLGYVIGMLYKLVAFWKLAPRTPPLWTPFVFAVVLWVVSFVMLVAK